MVEVNPVYLQEKMIKAVRQRLNADEQVSIVTLGEFLVGGYQRLFREVARLSFAAQRNPLQYSYASAKDCRVVKDVFSSGLFLDVVCGVTGKQPSSFEVWRFGWRDYTILHDEVEDGSGFDVFFDATGGWDGLAGGSVVYVDGSGGYVRVPVRGNQLVIVKKKPGVRRFVEYVNHHADSRRRFLVAFSLGD